MNAEVKRGEEREEKKWISMGDLSITFTLHKITMRNLLSVEVGDKSHQESYSLSSRDGIHFTHVLAKVLGRAGADLCLIW
jgi:hypothetical protein